MKVNVYSENGLLIKEFGDDPEIINGRGARTVSDCEQVRHGVVRITFDDELFPQRGYIYGEVVVITY